MSLNKPFLQRLRLDSLDFLFNSRPTIAYNNNIIIIEIDDDNISKVGRWPWKRSWHAALAGALDYFGASTIYFDIIFSEDADQQDDSVFAEAIKKAGNVYLPYVFKEHKISKQDAFFPIDKLSSAAKGIGAINIYPDIDGYFRKMPLIFKGADYGIYKHITLKIAQDYLDADIKESDKKGLLLSRPEKENIKIPYIKDNKMLVNWYGKWKDTFIHYSYIDVINAYNSVLSGKKPNIDTEKFKNSICLIGITAIGLYELKPVPIESVYPGIGIIASSISNILNRNFISIAPDWVIIFFIFAFPVIPAILISGERPFWEISITVVFAGVFFIVSYVLFRNNIWLDFSIPLFSLLSGYFCIESYNFIRISLEKKHFFKLAINDGLTGLYNIRYFKMLLKAECLMGKTEPDKKFCVVMSDVDHFKKFNDTYGHQVGDLVLKEVSSVLKKSVRGSDVVARYGGEEMIVLLRGTPMKSALEVAERMRKDVEEHIVKDDKNTYKVTISIGVASFNVEDDEESIIKRADDGLYKAKESGRNKVETSEKI